MIPPRCAASRAFASARVPIETTIFATEDTSQPSPSLWERFQLRYIEYGYADEPLHLLIGELSGVSLGHGTVVNDYYNVIDNTRFKLGLQANLNSPYAGAELFMDHIASPSIIGGRAYIRPLAIFTGHPMLTQLGLGSSFITDLNAPLRLASTATGRLLRDGLGRPISEQVQDATFLSTDLELNLLELPRVRLGAYADLNWHLTQGMGTHVGARLKVDPLRALAISLKLEHRWLGSGYVPDYFGPIYEIERYQSLGWGAARPSTKLQLSQSSRQDTQQGTSLQAAATVFDLITLSGALSEYQGDNNTTLWARLSVAPTDIYAFSLFYYKSNAKDLSSIRTTGDSLVAAETRLGIVWPVYLFGQYNNLWFEQSQDNQAQLAQWRAGIGASFSL